MLPFIDNHVHVTCLAENLFWLWYTTDNSTMGKFIGIGYQGKDIVFRFIIECSSLRDFYGHLGSS